MTDHEYRLNHKAYCLLSAAYGDYFEDMEVLEQYIKELPLDLKEEGIEISVEGMNMDNLGDYVHELRIIDEKTSPV